MTISNFLKNMLIRFIFSVLLVAWATPMAALVIFGISTTAFPLVYLLIYQKMPKIISGPKEFILGNTHISNDTALLVCAYVWFAAVLIVFGFLVFKFSQDPTDEDVVTAS